MVFLSPVPVKLATTLVKGAKDAYISYTAPSVTSIVSCAISDGKSPCGLILVQGTVKGAVPEDANPIDIQEDEGYSGSSVAGTQTEAGSHSQTVQGGSDGSSNGASIFATSAVGVLAGMGLALFRPCNTALF